MEYDQRAIVKFFWTDGTDACKIATRLQAQFAEHAYQLRIVQFWISEIWRRRQDLHDEIRAGRPPLNNLDVKILAILDKSPFESARPIAERLCVSHPTVLEHLHKSIGFRSFHLRWVLHLLTDDFRQKRKEYATAMLPFLHAAERDGWHHHVTGDKSWLFFKTSRRRMSTPSRDGHKAEIWYSEQTNHVYDHMESKRLL
jgi:hypothetical protein